MLDPPCAPVLQVLITEPSLWSVELSSPRNRILLAHLSLHDTAVLFFALHLQISTKTAISKQICSERVVGLEIWRNPWQIFASLRRKPREYFSWPRDAECNWQLEIGCQISGWGWLLKKPPKLTALASIPPPSCPLGAQRGDISRCDTLDCSRCRITSFPLKGGCG